MLLRPLRWWWSLEAAAKWVIAPFFFLVLLICWLVFGPIILLYEAFVWPLVHILERLLASRGDQVESAWVHIEVQLRRRLNLTDKIV